MSYNDDLSLELKAIQDKLRGEEGDEETETELLKELLGDMEGGEQIKDLAGLKKLLHNLVATKGKFGDMEKGHTQATQKLSALEKKLGEMGVRDTDAFLTGGSQETQSRKDRLGALKKKYNLDPSSHPFWDELIEVITGDDHKTGDTQKAAMAAWAFSTMLGKSVWQHQIRTNKKYEGIDDKTMETLVEKLGGSQEALQQFMQDGKNPLEGIYTKHFAELHPEILEKKIKEASMKESQKDSGFVETPGTGSAPGRSDKSGGARSPDQIAKEIEKATGGAVKMPPTSGD